jgi:hypothetical protein
VRNAQAHAQCCNVFDVVGTLHARGRAAEADSSQAMLGAIGRAMCCWHNTGNGHKRCKKKASIDSLKLYAHSRIISYKEFQCFEKLITKESNWRVEAINPNGNHFGLGQMRNTKYRNLDGYRMIDWSLRYINHRYAGSSCAAFEHWRNRGWH